MSRLFYFILLAIGLLLLLTQCKDAPTTKEVNNQLVEEETAKATIEPVKKIATVADTMTLAKNSG